MTHVSDRLYGHDRLYAMWNGWRWALRAAKRAGIAAAMRELWRAYVLGDTGETCNDCGRAYLSWWSDANLYGRVTGRWPTPWSDGSGRAEPAGGLFCLACFDRRGRANGISLVWEPRALQGINVRDAAKEYRDAEWALRILDGEGCPRLDPRWNAAVDRWRVADAALASLLGEHSPFFSPPTAVHSAELAEGAEPR